MAFTRRGLRTSRLMLEDHENILDSVIIGTLAKAKLTGDVDQVVPELTLFLHLLVINSNTLTELTHFITY